MSVLDKLREEATNDTADHPFGKYTEEAVISLMIDHPDEACGYLPYIKPNLFSRIECQYVASIILKYNNDYGSIPTRGTLSDIVAKSITVDSDGHEDIMKIVERVSNQREVASIKKELVNWARSKAYGLLFDPDTIQKYTNGDFDYIEQVFNKARSIQENTSKGLWFFDEIERFFVEDSIEHFTSGFKQLDHYLGEGGPGRKETMIYMAPTNVGKSIALVNAAFANVLQGRNVLFITLEMSDIKVGLRALGVATGRTIDTRFTMKENMMQIVNGIKASGKAGDLGFFEYPSDMISTNEIHALIDTLKRTKGWVPDVVVIDYLELMISRNQSDNDDTYKKQKAVSVQTRALAQSENVLVITATQTNRSGNDKDAKDIGVDKISESYGKAMSTDFIVSINQSDEDRDIMFDDATSPTRKIIGPGKARLFIAKNRSGARGISIPINIDYRTMRMQEVGI